MQKKGGAMRREKRRERATILYVEDSQSERDELLRVLERFCGRVVCAANGEEAVKLFDQERPDLVLSDICMPKTDGMTLAKLLKQKNPFVPVVLISAHNESDYLLRALRIGVRDFLFKPVEVAEVISMLDRIIDETQAQRQCEALRLQGRTSEELAAVMRTTELLKPLADSAPVLMWVADSEGSCFFFNESWIQFTGTPMEALVGQGWIEDLHPDDRDRVMAAFHEAIQARDSFTVEYRLRRHDGEYRLVHDRGVPRYASGIYEGYIGSCIDITDLQEAKRETEVLQSRVSREKEKRREKEALLIQQSKMAAMGEMIGAIAHQWRQPLNAFSILVQDIPDALLAGELDEAYARDLCEKAMAQIAHMSHTIDDFRGFFRPDREARTFALQEAVEAIFDLIGAQLKSHGIAIKLQMPDEPVMVTGPLNQLKQALLNIVSNAQDAIDLSRKCDGAITVSLTQGERATLRVCDNGGGIAPEVLDRLFEPYVTTKEAGKGTGIGLYMTRSIIQEQFKGEIHASSHEEGACFEVVL